MGANPTNNQEPLVSKSVSKGSDLTRKSTLSVAPYYEDEFVTIYHGDAAQLLSMVEADVLVTDPPYGVDLGKTAGTGGRHGLVRSSYEAYEDSYDNYVNTVVPIVEASLAIVQRGGVFTGPHLQELPKAAAIGGVFCPAGAGRHPWGFKTFLPVMFYGTAPNLHKGAQPNVIKSSVTAEKLGHPCPKPLPWMRWLVQLVSLPGETVLDPFMGSGTTLRAAKDTGRKAIGIEIEERYCEIAAARLSQEVLVVEHVGGAGFHGDGTPFYG